LVTELKFDIFFHPHVCPLIEVLNKKGVSGLLTLGSQQRSNDKLPSTAFHEQYGPTVNVDTDFPHEDVDFSLGGAYSLYNWETFFHIPLLIATRLSKNQQFADAQQWFHYIFDPTDSSRDSSPRRY
jgi:hypothetical protein